MLLDIDTRSTAVSIQDFLVEIDKRNGSTKYSVIQHVLGALVKDAKLRRVKEQAGLERKQSFQVNTPFGSHKGTEIA